MPVLPANLNDIPALASLLNNAYRGDESKAGWTSEAHLFRGNKRTDEDRIRDLLNSSGTVFLKFVNEPDNIIGCVFLQKKKSKLYLGMLSVSPTMQSKGIGKQLLKEAEVMAKMQNCTTIFMTVISIRKELIKWYERHGYFNTGKTVPFPAEESSGTPVMPLEMIILEKILP
ncbi:MAG TPA: GNAT family N-acetyltransferase [Chitinophagaceae bacterium]|nr:GNAT family N-acetyltransferase [Chitinophagaceae bacterium]